MNKPRKHAELIKAWADGAEIEYLPLESTIWRLVTSPCWEGNGDYRIKPKPDVVMYGYSCTKGVCRVCIDKRAGDNLKLTFDGETGKLKAAEVLQ